MRTRRTSLTASLLLSTALAGLLAAQEKAKKLTLEEFLRQVPTRVADQKGAPGDMVNFVLVGSQAQVEQALAAAGWQLVDRTKKEAALRAVLDTIKKKPYTQMPMSELFLFGRVQDFGYARAEPIRVVAERHHFRLWKAPWQTDDGRDLWIGAGTHDIGLEEDKRSGSVTHKIDPEVDKERDYIAQTLEEAGRVAGRGAVLPPQPIREARTATGGSFQSNGRVVVIILK